MKFATLAAALVAVAWLGGCASNSQLADQVVRANLVQEDATNQLLLLNVLRARDRMPMHFSRVSAVRPALGAGNPTVTVPTPFGPDFRQQVYNLQTQFAVQQGTDVQVLDSQEYVRGITTPVSAGLLAYFIDQGWPQQMVLHLLVRSIEVYEEVAGAAGQKELVMVDRLDNAPNNAVQLARFQRAIDALRQCDVEAKSVTVARIPFSPPIDKPAAAQMQGLAAVKSADLAFLPVDSEGKEVPLPSAAAFRLVREVKATQLDLQDRVESRPRKCEGLRLDSSAGTSRPGDPQGTASPVKRLGAVQQAVGEPASARIAAMVFNAASPGPATASGGSTKYANFNLRSPEAVLYYLGEIARRQEAQPEFDGPRIRFRAQLDEDEKGAVLFRLRKGGSADGEGVSIQWRGHHYSVSQTSVEDRSTHTLSFIHQLMMLQNKGAEAPATSNIRIIQ